MQVNGTNSNTLSYINQHKQSVEKSLQSIGTGKKEQIDDATLALINDAIGSNIGALSQGLQNANNAVAMMQIADGALQSLSSAANDLNTLSVASNNAALSSDQQKMLAKQADGIKNSMQSTVEGATFNGQKIFGSSMEFSLGNSSILANVGAVNISSLDINSPQGIQDFMKSLQDIQSSVGSTTNELGSSTNSILTQISSLSSAKSQMSDTDVADTVKNFQNQNLQLNASLMAQAHINTLNSAMISQLIG
jgi:flagellin